MLSLKLSLPIGINSNSTGSNNSPSPNSGGRNSSRSNTPKSNSRSPNPSCFSHLSIDKQPISFEQIISLLQTKPSSINTSTPSFDGNIKIFECFDASNNTDKLWKRDFQVKPFQLYHNQKFNSISCYLVLHLYKQDNVQHFSSTNNKSSSDLDHEHYQMIEQLFTLGSFSNESLSKLNQSQEINHSSLFTSRGLEFPFASSKSSLIDELNNNPSIKDQYHFDLYVWYGKDSQEYIKSRTIERAITLERLLNKVMETNNLFEQGLLTCGNPLTIVDCLKAKDSSSIDRSVLKNHHLLERIKERMILSQHHSSSLLSSTKKELDDENQSIEKVGDKLNGLLLIRKRPINIAGVVFSEGEESLESPRKKERTLQLSPLNTKGVEHVEEPKILSGRELAKQCHLICSPITDYLFVGSVAVASDRDKLNQNGVTHIVNAAASVYCDNYFPNEFKYYSLSLYDDPNESIIGSFYGVIDFVENAIKNGGKVLIHCQMGVSRSCCLTIAYMMWKYKLTFSKALEEVKTKRACCSPNAGFLVQLSTWESMLGLSEKSLKNPKSYLFRISPLNNFYPIHKELVPKLCMNTKHLDSRTCFILNCRDGISYFWIGCQSNEELTLAARGFIEIQKSYSPSRYHVWKEVNEGKEDEEFFKALDTLELDTRRPPTTEYSDLKFLKMTREEAEEILKFYKSDQKKDDPEPAAQYKEGKLFSYNGESFNEFGYYDSEDITDDLSFIILPSTIETDKKILVLVGYDVDIGDLSLEEKVKEIGKQFIQHHKLPSDTEIIACEEDDAEFFSYFKNG
ncbi:hypothetical protein ABK040_003666 [Willaertia magna]